MFRKGPLGGHDDGRQHKLPQMSIDVYIHKCKDAASFYIDLIQRLPGILNASTAFSAAAFD